MPTFEEILHNIKDHIEAALAILRDGKAVGGARERLIRHIRAEEAQNRVWLEALLKTAPETREFQIAYQHSELIDDFLSGEEIAPDLVVELLDHFLEEHREGFLAPADAVPPPSRRAEWTVGSLLGQPI